jgi:hypothetical protein
VGLLYLLLLICTVWYWCMEMYIFPVCVFSSGKFPGIWILYLYFTPTCPWRWNKQCSETSAYKIQTPGNFPEENTTYRTRRKFEIKNTFFLLYVFFWEIPRHLNFICRRFGTHCLVWKCWNIYAGKVLARKSLFSSLSEVCWHVCRPELHVRSRDISTVTEVWICAHRIQC